MNNISIMGNLTSDPEMSYTPDGLAVTKGSVADNYFSKGQKKVTFWKYVAFGKTAETIATHFHKGKEVFIAGTLASVEFTGRSGDAVKYFEVTVHQIAFGQGGSKEDKQADPRQDEAYQKYLEEHPF